MPPLFTVQPTNFSQVPAPQPISQIPNAFAIGQKIGEQSALSGPVAFANSAIDAFRTARRSRFEADKAGFDATVARAKQFIVNNPDSPQSQQIIARAKANPAFATALFGANAKNLTGGSVAQIQQLLGGANLPAGASIRPESVKVGNVTFKVDDPQKKAAQARLDLNKKEAGKLADILPKLEIAETSLNQLIDTFDAAIPQLAQSGSAAIFGQGPRQSFLASIGQNEKLRAFDQSKKAFAGVFAKGVFQEAGVLTNQDIKRATDSLPNQFDSAESAQIKINILRGLIDKAKANFQAKKSGLLVDNFEVAQKQSSSLPTPEEARAELKRRGRTNG